MNQAAIDTLRPQPVPDQGLLIDGQTVPALEGETLAVLSPIDGQRLCSLAAARDSDVDRAVAAARRSFEQGVWSRRAPAERKKVLHRIADAIEREQLELAVLGVRDNGTEISMALKAEPGQRGRHLPLLRGAGGQDPGRDCGHGRFGAGPGPQGAGGCGGGHRPVELPADDWRLETRARTGGRQFGGAQAVRRRIAVAAAGWPKSAWRLACPRAC
jgi:hypothetical protein